MNKRNDSNALLRETIEGKLALYSTAEKKKIAAALGMSQASFYRYRKNPERFPLWQLSILLRVLHVEQDNPVRRIV